MLICLRVPRTTGRNLGGADTPLSSQGYLSKGIAGAEAERVKRVSPLASGATSLQRNIYEDISGSAGGLRSHKAVDSAGYQTPCEFCVCLPRLP